MKKLLFILTIMITGLLTACTVDEEDKLTVAVSIVPQQAILEAVAGDLVEVVTVIPAGASPANYDPDARTMTEIMSSDVYFTIGVPTEAGNILGELDDINVVHLDELVGEVYPDLLLGEEHEDEDHDSDHEDEDHEDEDHDDEDEDHEDEEHDDHDHTGRDPHIWLSVKRMVLMTEIVRDELIKLDEANKEVYTENAETFINELNELDAEVEEMFHDLTFKTFIIYHPSFGYFADDYGLTMLELEEGGNEASARRLKEVIDFARDNDIHTIFHQDEISSSQVLAIVDELEAELVLLTPLSDDYINNYRKVAESILETLK